MSQTQLDERLRAVARNVDWPGTADLAPAIASAVARNSRSTRRRFGAPAWRPAIATLAIMLLAVTAVLALSPAARTAVARLLGFPGIGVEVRDDPLPELRGMGLGKEVVSLAEAEVRTGLDLRTLPLPGERVSVDDEAGAVHIAYRYEGRRVVLLTQLRGDGESAFNKQSSEVFPTEVDGEFALWVAGGGEHAVLRGRGETVEGRLSQNALLWASDGVTYRLEIAAELPEAVRLAERLR